MDDRSHPSPIVSTLWLRARRPLADRQLCLPSNIWLDVGVAPTGTGAPEGDRRKGRQLRVLHLLTPATETTTWYFYAPLRDADIDDEQLSEISRKSIEFILEEDKTILKAQQQAVLDNPGERMMNVGLDEASVRVRRILKTALDSETAAASAA